MRHLRFLIYPALSATLATSALAFPPAPHHTVFGIVRDQVGTTLDAEGASLLLLKAGQEIGRTPIVSGLKLDQNYELKIRIDANRPATQIYNTSALPAGALYSVAVEMDGTRFYPIEVDGNLQAGKGSERVRLDLNLGEDTDADGLPDVWEQWQLFQSGHIPGDEGWDLSLIDRDGDFDKDGQSNHAEYIAGTFAGDATDRFILDIKEKSAESVRLEFFAITGKTYTLETSTDGKTWSRTPFTTEPDGEPASAFQSTGVDILPIYCVPSADRSNEIYRLTVR